MVEKEAGRFPVEIIKVAGNGGVEAVLSIDSSIAEAKKNKLRLGLSDHETPFGKPAPARLTTSTGLADREDLKASLNSELGRVKTSRLPCSLLLVKVDGMEEPPKAISAIKKEVPRNGLLAHYDHTVLSILLPGVNKKRALRRARAIQDALNSTMPHRVSIGLTVCTAREIPQTDVFIKMTAEELHKSEKAGGKICHRAEEAEDDVCQVTAEERAQLFSFLTGGKK